MPFSLVIWIYDEIRRYILRRYPGCKYTRTLVVIGAGTLLQVLSSI